MANNTIEYKKFRTRLMNALDTELGDGIKVSTKEIASSGDNPIEACSISIKGKKFTPVFYPAYFYDKYRSGTPFLQIIEDVKDSIRFSSEEAFDERDVKEYSLAKGHIIPKFVNRKENDSWVSSVVNTEYLDFSVIFIYVIRADGEELVSFTVSWDMLSDWEIDVKTLLHDSIQTAMRLFPLSIQSIEDVLGLSDGDYFRTFYVLSNSRRHYGAVAMLYDHALLDFAKRIGDNFHIIPSSVHEVLLVPDSLHIPADELDEMLVDVNSSIVRDDEVLSDSVYYYDRRTDSVMIR